MGNCSTASKIPPRPARCKENRDFTPAFGPQVALPSSKDDRMTSLQDPVMDLVRASFDPAARTARVCTESPVCQVVIRAAEADLAAGGADNVNMLAVGAGVAAAGLTAWLAQERFVDTAVIIADFEKGAAIHGIAHDPLIHRPAATACWRRRTGRGRCSPRTPRCGSSTPACWRS